MTLDQMNEPIKRAIDNSAAGASLLTTFAYYAEQLAPILTCAVLLITFAWYVVRFIDRSRKRATEDE